MLRRVGKCVVRVGTPIAGATVLYGITGVVSVKGYHSLSFDTQKKVPKTITNIVHFYEANYRSLRCLSTIGFILADYSFTNIKFDYYHKDQEVTMDDRNAYFHNAYMRGATKTLKTLEDLGGVFVKLGQEVSLMKGLIPDEYVQMMTKLQDNVPSITYDEVRYVVKRSFGKEIEELFAEFSEEPVAAASLAQVHKAKTHDGLEVAVKIKYPKVKNFLSIDLFLHNFAAELYGWLRPKYKMNKKSREHLYNHLRMELDFIHEAGNIKRAKECLKDIELVYIPDVEDELTRDDVLTMEYINGYKINDLEAIEKHGWDKSEIAKTVLQMFSDQIFIHGFIHADPHPGNVFIRPMPEDESQCQVVLLDHGLYADIDEETRIRFANFWVNVVAQNNEELKQICDEWNISHFDLFASLMMLQSYDGVKLDTIKAEEVANQGGSVDGTDSGSNPVTLLIAESHLNKDRWVEMVVSLPPQIHLILRSMFITRALNVALGNNVNRFEIMARTAARAVDMKRDTEPLSNTWKYEFYLFCINWRTWGVTKVINTALWFRDLVKYLSW